MLDKKTRFSEDKRFGTKRIVDNALGKKIKIIRKRKRLSQNKVAQNAGIDTQTLRALERGVGIPKLNTIIDVCKGLEITQRELFDEDFEYERLCHNDKS